MLASRVAHASAKGRSRESGYRTIVWVYPKVATKIFRATSRLRRHYLIRSRPASTTYENAKLCTRATFWGSPSLPTTKARAVGFLGRTRIAPTSNGMSGEARLAKCLGLASVACKRSRSAAGNRWMLGINGLHKWNGDSADFSSRHGRLCYNFYRLIRIAPSKGSSFVPIP